MGTQTKIKQESKNKILFLKLIYETYFVIKKAQNLFEVLIGSKNDGRFNQWIVCFALVFNSSRTDIESDYYELL